MAYEQWVSEIRGSLPQALLAHSSLGISSLKQARKILEGGCCSVNGEIVRLASRRVSQGDSIEVYPLDTEWHEESCSILFEDASLVLISKPAGVPVTEEAIKKILPFPVFLVHRLDKWTSGVLLLAKTREAQKRLEDLFRRRDIKKEYVAIVDGKVSSDKGEIDQPIEVKKKGEGEIICGITKEGKYDAVTRYKVLMRAKKESLLLVTPKTGRTHQVRVHLSSMGHPILGDYQYASSLRSMQRPFRQMLHAWSIFFRHPFSHRNVYIKAPLPLDFHKLAGSLFGESFMEVLCGL